MLVQRRFGRHGLQGRRGRSAQRRGPGGEGRQDHLRCGWPETERGVWTGGVVVPPPAFDHRPGLPRGGGRSAAGAGGREPGGGGGRGVAEGRRQLSITASASRSEGKVSPSSSSSRRR